MNLVPTKSCHKLNNPLDRTKYTKKNKLCIAIQLRKLDRKLFRPCQLGGRLFWTIWRCGAVQTKKPPLRGGKKSIFLSSRPYFPSFIFCDNEEVGVDIGYHAGRGPSIFLNKSGRGRDLCQPPRLSLLSMR